VASELKALEGYCTKNNCFLLDIIWQVKMGSLYNGTKRMDWLWCCKDNETSIPAIKEALEAAVHRQLMSDVPYGVLLRRIRFLGYFGYSQKYAQKRIESGDVAALVSNLLFFSRAGRVSGFSSRANSGRS
jgi:asparagine synthase (glutamine-hydrolysing)